MDWKSFAAGALIVLALLTLTGAGGAIGRWEIVTANTPGGVWRLDTVSGALSYCTVQECERAGQDR